MAIVNGCCCCRTLRSGSYAAASFILVIHAFMLFANRNQASSEPQTEDEVSAYRVATAIRHLSTIFSVTLLIFSILLMIGLKENKPRLFIPWLIAVLFDSVMDIFRTYLLIVLIIHYFAPSLGGAAWTILVLEFVICGTKVWGLLCVYSQYKELTASASRLAEMVEVAVVPTDPRMEDPPAYVADQNYDGSTYRLIKNVS